MNQLRLVIPALFSPDIALSGLAPALEKLLSRAEITLAGHATGYEASLCQLFGLATTEELPLAALTYPIDCGPIETGYWLRADPVYLYADLYRLILHAAPPLDENDSEHLASALKPLLADSGLTLKNPTPTRWYLHSAIQPQLRTTPPSLALGQDINTLLPQGPNTKHWHALLTECQMLLHNHPLNQAREQRGLATVNSLWFWGAGELPQAGSMPEQPHQDIYGNDILLRGLTHWRKTALNPLPLNANECLEIASAANVLVVLPSTLSLQQLEQDWFAPLLKALRGKKIMSLQLLPCDGRRFSIKRSLYAFWRKPRALADWL